MRVGVYFTPRKEHGGVYQYSVEILESLSKVKGHQYVIINTSPDIPSKYKKDELFTIVDISSQARDLALKTRDILSGPLAFITTIIISSFYKLRSFNLITPLYKISQKHYIDVIDEQNLDLIFYPTSSDLSFLSGVPSVVTVHDLQHRINPQFKEVSAGGRWEYREYGFINISRNAFKILVDSEVGKNDMIKYYPMSKNKIIVLPYLPPSYINERITKRVQEKIIKKLKLPKKYIYYPSKFWPHKNHISLIKALKILNERGIKVDLVLTGAKEADFSSFDEVMSLVSKSHLTNQIHYLGYVDDIELSTLYKKASALVMPTYFGPTNIPVLEAWKMGIPVIYSNIHGCREQLGDAGLLINPDDPDDIADKIAKVYTNSALSESLAERGKKRLSRWDRKMFTEKIMKILSDFEKKNGTADNRI